MRSQEKKGDTLVRLGFGVSSLSLGVAAAASTYLHGAKSKSQFAPDESPLL